MSHERHADPLQHVNKDHAGDLLLAARVLAGHADATAAHAEAIDRHGIDLVVETSHGPTAARLDFAEAIPEDRYPDGVRVAFVRLVRQARTVPAPPGAAPTEP